MKILRVGSFNELFFKSGGDVLGYIGNALASPGEYHSLSTVRIL